MSNKRLNQFGSKKQLTTKGTSPAQQTSPAKSLASQKSRHVRAQSKQPQHPKKWPIDQGIIVGGSGTMVLDQDPAMAHGNNQLRSLIPNHLPLRSSHQHPA